MYGHGLVGRSLAHHNVHFAIHHRLDALSLSALGLLNASHPTPGILRHVWAVRGKLHDDLSGRHESGE